MTSIDEAVKAIRLAREAIFDALPKVGEPESIWCEVRGEHLRTLLAALDQAQAELTKAADWIEEAVGYTGCTTWSPSLTEQGVALLDRLRAAIDSTPGATHD